MALFFGVNIEVTASPDESGQAIEPATKRPSRLIRWLFRKRQARLG